MRDTELDALVVRYRDTARRVARKFASRLPVGCTVEDLEAHLWSECWRAILDAEGRQLRVDLDAYVFGAAVNKARNFCVQNRNRGVRYAPRRGALRLVNERADDDGLSLAELVVAREAAEDGRTRWTFEQWQQMLSRVTPRARRVVLLRVFDGLSPPACAAHMGCSEDVVAREWRYAIDTLRALFPELRSELAHA